MSFPSLLRELRNACRLLARAPGTTALVALVLGIALAGNVTLFSIIDTALFKPLAVPDADRLVNIYTVRRDAGHGGLSYPDYADLKGALEDSRLCEEVFGYSGLMATASIAGGRPEMVFGEIVSANYFAGLRAPLILGTGAIAADDRPGQPAQVVVGHRYWQRAFGGDAAVVGQMIRLNGLPFTIAGVARADFSGVLFSGLAADVWVPLAQLERVRGSIRDDRAERWLFVRARLRPGVTLDSVRAASDVVGARLAASFPASNADRTFRVLRTSDVLVNPEADRAIRPLAIAVMLLGGVVLAVAAANIAGMLMARMSLRTRELAIRASLGATRKQLTSMLAAEAVVLGVAVLALGIGLSRAVLDALQSWKPALPVPLNWTFALDARVAGFAVLLTAATLLLVVVVPAWRATRINPLSALRGEMSRVRRRFGREVLLIPQVALSLVLLIVAGLFARSLQRAASIDPGFSAKGTAVMALNLGLSGYDEPRARQFWDEVLRRVRADAGLRAAALTDRIPMDLYGSQSAAVATDVTPEPRTMQRAAVGDGYFEALGIPLRAGRTFTDADRSPSRAVVILSDSAARELWPNETALGRRMRVSEKDNWRTVVGIVGDVQLLETLGESGAPLVYVPLTEGHTRLLRVAASARPGVADIERRLIASARAVDPEVAVFETRLLSEHLDTTMLPFRAAAWMALAAGAFGLLLTLAGVAGSVAQTVVSRAREIGIRIALGSSRAAVVRAVGWPAARSTMLGLALGWIASVGAAQGLAAFLFGIAALDAVAFSVVPVLVLCAVIAATLPAVRRALRLTRAAVLRDE